MIGKNIFGGKQKIRCEKNADKRNACTKVRKNANY